MKIIAHRGASGYMPENTLAAFEHAIHMEADMIELDVYCLRSGELVVIHDKTVNRTTNGSGKVERYNLEQIRALDAGQSQQVPLLKDVLDLVDKRVAVNIELKGRYTVKPLADLLQSYVIEKGWSAEHFVVSSFKHGLLRQFMRIAPEIPVCALIDKTPFWLRPLCYNKNIHGINFNADYIRAQDVALARRLGKKVYVYTVNSYTAAQFLNGLEVDGIFTNYPDIVQAFNSPTAAR